MVLDIEMLHREGNRDYREFYHYLLAVLAIPTHEAHLDDWRRSKLILGKI